MPKPYFIPRPSGLYVRFLVPGHARSTWGSRFILRSLGARRGDEARLAAARLGYALNQFFSGLRAMGKKGKSADAGTDMAYVHIDGRRIRRRITDDPDQWTDHARYQVEERLDGSWVIIADGVQELGQLHTEDVEEVAGIWGLHIAARFLGQRIKNRQSKRFVPIHPALLKAGFLNYVAQVREELGSGPLFPGLGAKPGDAISDWFNRTYLRQRCRIQGEGQVFHCFRHTFSTAADRLNIPEGRLARITGHSQGTSVLRGHYIDVPTLPERAATVALITHSAVTLQPYEPEAFTNFFERMKRTRRREEAVKERAARTQARSF
ncbi:hypothetical protein QFZ41_000466 [Luteibacter sp. W1I16]|uniref:hypothetical protein n=1 Tax=Luteibacter sp. W1I16 TaxID=3373922 RepID=UPI003D1F4C36